MAAPGNRGPDRAVALVDRLSRCEADCGFLRRLVAWFCRMIVIIFCRRSGGDVCIYIPDRIINRPDPCIYSQFLLMKLGQPVTWDNPDVRIFLAGVEQNTYDLTVNTEYDVTITVHNSSRDIPALGTLVDVRWIEFGAGAQIRHPIAVSVADVPVWPATATVAVKWRTPATPGHFCIEVQLTHPDDGNPTNNLGWNNTQVKAAASTVDVPIRIFNSYVAGPPPAPPAPESQRWTPILTGWGGAALAIALLVAYFHPEIDRGFRYIFLPIAGYIIGVFAGYAVLGPPYRLTGDNAPPRPHEAPWNLVEIVVDSYRFHDRKGKEADPEVMFAPRPPAWPAKVEPNLFHFAPNETFRDVILTVDAPDFATHPEVFNVNALQAGHPLGGVTVTVRKER